MTDWDDIRYFLAVARHGSVTAAAAALQVNHSTVSRRIQAFESRHDTRLFERLASGYVMTQAAENIYTYAAELEQKVQGIERSLYGQDSRLQGGLCLTLPTAVASEIIMPHMGEFYSLYPGIELEILATTAMQNMAAREADIAVRLTAQPPENLVGRQVGWVNQGVYVSQKYLDRRDGVDEIIVWQDETGTPDWVTTHFNGVRTVLRADNVTTIMTAVQAGMGMARLPCALADRQDDLLRLPIELPPPVWGVWVLSHVDLRSTARVRVCREFLIDLLQRYRPLFAGEQSRYTEW